MKQSDKKARAGIMALVLALMLVLAAGFGGQAVYAGEGLGYCGPHLMVGYSESDHSLDIRVEEGYLEAPDRMMDDYGEIAPPWYEYQDKIYKVFLYSDVYSIGENAFETLSNLDWIYIPVSLQMVGDNAFLGQSNLKVGYGGTEADWKKLMKTVGNTQGNQALLDAEVVFMNFGDKKIDLTKGSCYITMPEWNTLYNTLKWAAGEGMINMQEEPRTAFDIDLDGKFDFAYSEMDSTGMKVRLQLMGESNLYVSSYVLNGDPDVLYDDGGKTSFRQLEFIFPSEQPNYNKGTYTLIVADKPVKVSGTALTRLTNDFYQAMYSGQITVGGSTDAYIDLDDDGSSDLVVTDFDKTYRTVKKVNTKLTGTKTYKLNATAATALSGLAKEYYGTLKVVWTKTSLSPATVSGVKAKTYTGSAQTQSPVVKLGTTTLKANTDYTLKYTKNINAGTATMTITGKGAYKGSKSVTFKINPENLAAAASKTAVTGIKASYVETGSAIKPTPVVKAKVGSTTKTLKAGTDYTVKYTNNIKPGTATVTITGKGNFSGSVKKTFKITAKQQPASYARLAGADRYETSLAIAAEYKKALGVSKFDTICVADGVNFPDALAGAYFAYRNKAPIVDIRQNAPTGPQTLNAINYVKANLKPGGKVYILGGPGSVPASVEESLKKAGFKIERLWGSNRYGSNLAILKAAKVPAGTDFIVTTGTGFADALTASATGKPVLLVVGNALTADQKAYLAGAGAKSFTIVGSTNEVSEAIATQLKAYAPVTRLGAVNVYDRCLAVAKKYFPGTQTHINLADGRNFPDALCGGPLAALKGGPLFLTDGSNAVGAKIHAYCVAAKTVKATVYGGPASVAEETARYVLGIGIE